VIPRASRDTRLKYLKLDISFFRESGKMTNMIVRNVWITLNHVISPSKRLPVTLSGIPA
jgi:hypothetical protein